MSTGNELQAAAVDLLTTMQGKAIERFELELSDLRTTMMTMRRAVNSRSRGFGTPGGFRSRPRRAW